MKDESDKLFYVAAGPIAAIVLGLALVPLREATSASNLTFAFIILTIVVAEFGGRTSAVVTALFSSLSLDFFLTRPYLELTMNDKHDVIAFAGLTACGLVAAALGTHHGDRAGSREAARAHLALLQCGVRELAATGDLGARIGRILAACRETLRLTAAVVRGADEAFVAADDASHALRIIPGQPSAGETATVPVEGARIALRAHDRHVGWLDVWGSGAPSSVATGRALHDIAHLLAAALDEGEPTRGRRA